MPARHRVLIAAMSVLALPSTIGLKVAAQEGPPTVRPQPSPLPFQPALLPPLSTAAPPGSPVPGGQATLSLTAVFAGEQRPIRAGLVWRIFADRGPGSAPEQVAKLTTPTPTTALPAGAYIVHVSYGLASRSKRMTLPGGAVSDRLVLNAGALKLGGAIGQIPVQAGRLSFSIYQPLSSDSEGRLVASGVKPGELVMLPEGPYHVVSTYGDSNAIMRADLKVDTGKVTEATLNHRAATVTLKLVTSIGGEAFAGTAFSVLTPGGDVIREAIGSFPTVTLAEGDYVLIARQGGKVYTREFKVESGLDVDVEVVAPV